MTAEEILDSGTDVFPARLMEYGPISGEYHNAAMFGPRGNRLGPDDVAASPDYGFQQGNVIDIGDGKYRRVNDASYFSPGKPTSRTIELRDKRDQGRGFVRRPTAEEVLGPEVQRYVEGQSPVLRAIEPPNATPPQDTPEEIAAMRQEEQPDLADYGNSGPTTEEIEQYLTTGKPIGGPPTNETLEGVGDVVRGLPHFLGQLPRYAYQGAKFAAGGLEQRSDVMREIAKEAIPFGQSMRQGLESPVGSREFASSATQAAMMAAPGIELVRGMRAKPKAEPIPAEKPPVQAREPAEPPPVQRVSPETGETFYDYGERPAPQESLRVEEPRTTVPKQDEFQSREAQAGQVDTTLPESPAVGIPGEQGTGVGRGQGVTGGPRPIEAEVGGEYGRVPARDRVDIGEGPTGANAGGETQYPGTQTSGARSKIGQSIEAKAVEAKLTEGFGETAGYDPITIKDQAARAADLVTRAPEEARAVIRGDAPLPEGLRGTSLITAAEESLLKKPDAQLAYELANSPLTSATSAAAQEMRLMAERVPDSIASKFQEIRAAREAGARQRGELKHVAKSAEAEIRTEIDKVASKRPTWEAFVREITCA